jgi:hypothetical protein
MNGTGTQYPAAFYGTQGEYGRRNEPGGRMSAAAWVDEENRELYMWAGQTGPSESTLTPSF